MLNEKSSKVSNNHDEVHFKHKRILTVAPSENHSPTEYSPVKTQKMHAINMQFYKNWTPPRRPQETLIIAVISKYVTETKICSETSLNRNSHHAPNRNQSSDSQGFRTIQAPTEKYFRTDFNSRVQILSP